MTNNTPAPTRDFLQASKEKVVFEPSTMEEAVYVAQQLQRLGYKYYSEDYPKQLDNALKGSIYLDRDKTIMVTPTKAVGFQASADGFDNLYMPSSDVTAARIKPEEVMQGVFVFFPRTTVEARGLLVLLKNSGATIDEGDDSTFKLAGRAVYQGLILRDGRIGFAPGAADLREARITTATDLGVGVPVSLSPEQATIMAAFNDLTARLEQMNARLERLEGEILPKSIEKTGLKNLPKPRSRP